MNPRASAPSATARSASSSLVMPHTFTHTQSRVPDPSGGVAYIRTRMEAVVTPRTWRRTLLDWWPVALLALAYWVLHQLASTLTPIAHVQPQLGFDRFVF